MLEADSSIGAANRLLIAGIRDEDSLGWSAAEAWLDADPKHQVVATVRSKKAGDFIRDKIIESDNRLDYIPVEWSDKDAYNVLGAELKNRYGSDRQFAGFVHAIAGVDSLNFKRPAHELDPGIYIDAFTVSAVSLLQGIRAAKDLLKPNAGIVTFGFGRSGTHIEGYGGAMSVAKQGLSQLAIELAFSLGRSDPSARTLEIVTGYIPTRSGRGVASAQRFRHEMVSSQFTETAPLVGTNYNLQRIAAGKLAVEFMINPIFEQTTGQKINVDGGWDLRGPDLFTANTKK